MIALTESNTGYAPSPEALCRYFKRLLKSAWKDYRKGMRRCQANSSAKAIHQFRVKSRRLLTLLKLLETFADETAIAPLCRRVKKQLHRLSRLRDLQVQLLHVKNELDTFPEARPFYKALGRHEHRATRRVASQMRRIRVGKTGSRMAVARKAALRVLVESDDSQLQWEKLVRTVDRAYAKVVAQHARCRADDLESIHRLRVAFKNFRYLVELLQPVLPGVTRIKIKALRDFHDRMGRIQDARMLVAAVEEFCHRKPKQAAALQRFSHVARRRQNVLARKFLAEAACLREFWPPQSVFIGLTESKRIRSLPMTQLRNRMLTDK